VSAECSRLDSSCDIILVKLRNAVIDGTSSGLGYGSFDIFHELTRVAIQRSMTLALGVIFFTALP
jgi:hypothetical protein